MTKPRVFVSSTYYDLKYIRDNLERFISQMGYDPVLFESGDIAYEHDKPLDESAYKEIDNCHMQILIIGGRYGSQTSRSTESSNDHTSPNKMYEHYNSITKAEYKKAKENGMPIFVFVDKNVYAEYQTYKRNRENENINYAHVDNINIFKLLDEILSQKMGNYIKDFEKFEDIESWLTEQWAGLFTNYLIYKNTEQKIKTIESQIEELKSITITLKKYTEALMQQIIPNNYEGIIRQQDEIISKKEKAKIFVNEPLIADILEYRKIIIKSGDILKDEDVLDLFRKSNNLSEFLRNLNFSADEIVNFKEILSLYPTEEAFTKIKGMFLSTS